MKKMIVVLVIVGGGVGAFFLIPKTPPRPSTPVTSTPLNAADDLQRPSFNTERAAHDREARRQQLIKERQTDLQNEAKGFANLIGGGQQQ
jgi:hypothetical protein